MKSKVIKIVGFLLILKFSIPFIYDKFIDTTFRIETILHLDESNKQETTNWLRKQSRDHTENFLLKNISEVVEDSILIKHILEKSDSIVCSKVIELQNLYKKKYKKNVYYSFFFDTECIDYSRKIHGVDEFILGEECGYSAISYRATINKNKLIDLFRASYTLEGKELLQSKRMDLNCAE